MQNFTDIQSSQSLQSSLSLLMNNDKTALSCSAGNAFPTTSLQQGQLCWRIDQKKLYLLSDTKPTWALLVDLSSGASASVAELVNNALIHKLSGNDGGGFLLEKAESGTTLSGNLMIKLKGDQLQFFDAGNNKGFFLDMTQGAANVAQKIWHAGNHGKGSGLDADKLQGQVPGNASGNIPLNNGTLNKNLNAELFNGKNSSSYAPVDSPLFTGTPQGPTATKGNNTTQFATTAFVQTAVSSVDLASRLSLGGGTLTGDLRVASGHIQIYGHAGNGNSSVLYLNQNGDRYLHYDGSNYNMPGGELWLNGGQVWHAGNIGTPINGPYGVWMGANTTGNCGAFANSSGIETFRSGNALGARNYTVNCHDCNCDSGGGCCFPQGSLVLMADGSLKNIAEIKAGDWVQGPTRAWEVDYLYVTTLGSSRALMSFAEDRSLFWSAEHPLWAKKGEQQWFYVADLAAFKWEVSAGITVGLFDNDSFFTGEADDLQFAHRNDVWRERTPIPVLADPHMTLYLPIPKLGSGSDRMCFVDGYLVSTSANQWDKDYTKFAWSEELADKIKEVK